MIGYHQNSRYILNKLKRPNLLSTFLTNKFRSPTGIGMLEPCQSQPMLKIMRSWRSRRVYPQKWLKAVRASFWLRAVLGKATFRLYWKSSHTSNLRHSMMKTLTCGRLWTIYSVFTCLMLLRLFQFANLLRKSGKYARILWSLSGSVISPIMESKDSIFYFTAALFSLH